MLERLENACAVAFANYLEARELYGFDARPTQTYLSKWSVLYDFQRELLSDLSLVSSEL